MIKKDSLDEAEKSRLMMEVDILKQIVIYRNLSKI